MDEKDPLLDRILDPGLVPNLVPSIGPGTAQFPNGPDLGRGLEVGLDPDPDRGICTAVGEVATGIIGIGIALPVEVIVGMEMGRGIGIPVEVGWV